ncbi:MAG: DOPA 4,5-dioxygenase family protein, partial [Myxococcota bacterium]
MTDSKLKRARQVTGYHAHIYDRTADLEELRDLAQSQLPETRVGRLHSRPIGPHTQPMFQIAFEPAQLAVVVPWIYLNRGQRSVLIHPQHGDVVREHSQDALWLG